MELTSAEIAMLQEVRGRLADEFSLMVTHAKSVFTVKRVLIRESLQGEGRGSTFEAAWLACDAEIASEWQQRREHGGLRPANDDGEG